MDDLGPALPLRFRLAADGAVLVKLDEGPRLYSNLVGVTNDAIRIGMRVRARFEPVTDAVTLVKFEPDEGAAS